MEYFLLIIGAMFVNNFVLSQFLGICPFLGVSKKTDTALGMGLAVTFVMGVASVITWCVQKALVALGVEYLQTIAFILVIAALVQLIEMVLKKYMPALYSALGVYLPLITTNCAVLGVAILNIDTYGVASGISLLQASIPQRYVQRRGLPHCDYAPCGRARKDGFGRRPEAVQRFPDHSHIGEHTQHGVRCLRRSYFDVGCGDAHVSLREVMLYA